MLLVSCSPGITMEENLDQYDTAVFAGGCFWCSEAAFESLDGVKEVVSGYAGGEEENPSYKDVASGKTGHREAIKVYYDSSTISYQELVEFFFRQIDPTQEDGQFADKGFQYTTAIFYTNEEEKKAAEVEKEKIAQYFEKPIVTKIVPFTTFYEAEEEHQDYAKKRTIQYNLYKEGSGRTRFQKEQWSK